MQFMKKSVVATKRTRSQRRRDRKEREKDSFVGPGGLGSELKGFEYSNVPINDEYDEIQIEDL